ncbi:conserved hypothetical protein [Trichodesmium erythraeum IMS101]|uniref:VWA containing CoxE family protein n=1 Tax=Trichodesmium erythraeum (strain IMS101) TaxID=203124 RepID=Q115U9_TRIEI|nr:hypothetical protein [Trichodesmium erythraeum GBRTRLIN201]
MVDFELLIVEFETILLPLFNRLRQKDIPVGISEYLLAIKMIQSRGAWQDIERLKRLLCLLWVKSLEDQYIFNQLFEELVRPELEKQLLEADKSPLPKIDEDSTSPPQKTENLDINSNPISQVSSKVQKENKPQPNQPTNSIPIRDFSRKSLSEITPIKLRFRQSYNLIPRLPITRREMTSIWRNLRLLKREGAPENLDVQGTINLFYKMGFFSGVVLQPSRKNQVKLVLLIDCEGSMSPFKLLIDTLQESIEKVGLLNQKNIFYFHNVPRGYLFTKPNLTKPLPIEEILSQEVGNNSVVIVSDGGAARRTYDSERFHQTKEFIRQLSDKTYLYGWLNPVPEFQWRMTTAEDIATFIPMYSLNPQGLNDLVKILLGYPFPMGVNLHG